MIIITRKEYFEAVVRRKQSFVFLFAACLSFDELSGLLAKVLWQFDNIRVVHPAVRKYGAPT